MEIQTILDKIYKWLLKNIDKLLHLTVSYMLASLFGIWIAVMAGIAKEIYDQVKYKGWSWGDLIADGLGIAVYCLGVAIK